MLYVSMFLYTQKQVSIYISMENPQGNDVSENPIRMGFPSNLYGFAEWGILQKFPRNCLHGKNCPKSHLKKRHFLSII